MKKRRFWSRAWFCFAAFVLASPAALFFLWMLSMSLKPEVDNIAYPPLLIPSEIAWENYAKVLADRSYLTYLTNSLLVTGAATALGLLCGVPAAYGIARSRMFNFAILILVARMTPGLSYLIPLFILFHMIGLSGTLWPQIVIHLVLTLPIVIWVMIGFFEGLPVELEEAARIDGANTWQTFYKVALPLAWPGVMVSLILSAMMSWNNFLFGIVLASRTTRTLPVAVYNSLTFEVISWGPLAAAALTVTAPILVVTVLAQRQIVSGLTAGAVKGG